MQRHDYIIHQVNLHNKVLLTDLSDQIKVSHDTIRRDLTELSEAGKLIKIHGGAMSPAYLNDRDSNGDVYAYHQKRVIAKKAVSMIKDGMFVLTGGGTTILEMVRELPAGLNATFISGSIPALNEYAKHPTIEVIAIGDKVSKNSRFTVGSEAISKIKELQVDLCILGVNALNLETGVSDNDWDIVQVKKAMISSAAKLVCLTISEKINTRQPIQICEIKKIDTLITELPVDAKVLEPYKKAGIKVI